MEIRLKNYELTLFTLLTGITAAGYLWEANYVDTTSIENVFIENGHSFNYFTNVLSPKLGALLFIFLLYVTTYILNIPYLLINKARSTNQYIWIGIYIFIAIFLMALGANLATYFARPAYFSYGGYKIMALFGYNDKPLEDIFFGFGRASSIVIIYLLYACLREYITARIRKSKRRNYLTMIANEVALTFVIYLLIPFSAATFELIKDDFFFTIYVLFITPTLFIYLINTYWIFPSTDTKPWQNIRTISLIVVSTLFFTFLFNRLSFHSFTMPLWLTSWAIQLFLVTPITWLLYQQRKDKILQLRGTERALVKSKADLQLLRSQINPHFLFNALNTLYGTAMLDGSQRTADGIQKLGDMMRFMLHDNHLDYIPMSHEIQYLKNYLSLQKLRIKHSPSIIIEEAINEQNCNHVIAPMLLIPFVENAFKHGLHANEKSWIRIKLNCDKNNIRFEVRNSVHAAVSNDPEKEHSGIGLENVRERLHLFYENRHQLNYGSDGKEFVATLVLNPNQ